MESMTTFVLATDDVHTSAALCDYLDGRLADGDEVHAINSLPGGDETGSDEVRDGEDALNAVRSRLGARATLETHQLIRGNDVETDVIEYVEQVDADELVIGVRKRNPTAKVVFGSNAQQILLHANVPMVVIPLEDV
jgi:nucleotide-binding universal stress UspA family protein